MKKLWRWLKNTLFMPFFIAFTVIMLPIALLYAVWKISPFSKAPQASAEDRKKPLRDDVIEKAEAEWDHLKKKKKEKDHEKSISGIINDAGGEFHGQRVTVQRNGYFNVDGKYIKELSNSGD